MRILALADLHSEEFILERLAKIVERERFDLILIVGDITQNGPLSYAEDLLDVLRGEKVWAIHGNMDTQQVVDLLERRGIFLHMQKAEIGEWNFIGFGGSSPTPFNTPTEYEEWQIYEELNKFRMNQKTVLVTHSPPYNSGVDKTSAGMSAGSKSIRRIIEEKKPFMNVCGHIHEGEGETLIGSTRIVKVPAAMNGRLAEIFISEEVKVNLVNINKID